MRKSKAPLLLLFVLLMLGKNLLAKTENQASDRPYSSQTYFSFGAGFSLLQGVSENFYQDGHSNVQIGFMREIPFNPRVSLVTGLELERLTYSLDFFPELSEDSYTFIKAPEGIKYTRLFQNSLNLSTQARIYLKENTSKEKGNIFLQSGLRAGYNLSTTFAYRENSKNETVNLSDGASQFGLQAEIMLGIKGDYFEKLKILNASSFGLTYQFNSPLQIENVVNVRPVHLTWRFLF